MSEGKGLSAPCCTTDGIFLYARNMVATYGLIRELFTVAGTNRNIFACKTKKAGLTGFFDILQ
jgi:hypothetical protein